jgi:hypothetical protein
MEAVALFPGLTFRSFDRPVSHLKTLKRSMAGRAGFDLLRRRVLEAA